MATNANIITTTAAHVRVLLSFSKGLPSNRSSSLVLECPDRLSGKEYATAKSQPFMSLENENVGHHPRPEFVRKIGTIDFADAARQITGRLADRSLFADHRHSIEEACSCSEIAKLFPMLTGKFLLLPHADQRLTVLYGRDTREKHINSQCHMVRMIEINTIQQ